MDACKIIVFDKFFADNNRILKVKVETDAMAYYDRGNAYLNKGQYNKAISDYNRAIEINPGDATAYFNRGSAYVNIGNIYKERGTTLKYKIS